MICYKVKFTLDKPIPTIRNEYGRQDYDDEAMAVISSGFKDYNEKHFGKSCAFVFSYIKGRLGIAVVIDEDITIAELFRDVKSRAKLNGSYELEEVTIFDLSRYKQTAEHSRYELFYSSVEYTEKFCVEEYVHRGYSIERIAKHRNRSEVEKRAAFGLYDRDLLPELERIKIPRAIEGAGGHPVHYVIKGNNAKKACEDLISSLYENKRLRSKRFNIINEHEECDKSYGLCFRTSKGCTMVVDLTHYVQQHDDGAVYDVLNKRLYNLIKSNARDVLTVFLLPNELEKTAERIKKSLPELTFIEISEHPVMNNDAKKVLRAYCRKDKVKADKELLSMVAKDTGYNAANLRKMYDTWYANTLKTKVYPQYADFKKNLESEKDKLPQGSAYEKLTEMIGLEKVKQVIDQAVTYSKMQKLLADRGMPNAKRVMHMVFTGNPGTAKTTVARLFAQILKDNEVLSVGDLIECGRSDLVGMFVGWTAVQVKEMFKKAKGSVLFIDEAYSLLDDRSGSFGDEAINTIVQEMENCRDDMVVIFAGYPKEMNEFISRNPGLRSRISFYVDFDNYSADELFDITKLIAKNNGYKLADDTCETLVPIFENALASGDFGNGRFARNLVEQAQLAQSVRLSALDFDSLSGDDLITLCAQDFSQINTGIRLDENRKQRIGFTRVG